MPEIDHSRLTPLQVRRRQRWISVLQRVASTAGLSRDLRNLAKVAANEIQNGIKYGNQGPDGPEWVRDAADLEVGHVYWMRRVDGGQWRLSECFEEAGRKCIDRHLRRWACPENDQFTGEFEAFGPVQPPA